MLGWAGLGEVCQAGQGAGVPAGPGGQTPCPPRTVPALRGCRLTYTVRFLHLSGKLAGYTCPLWGTSGTGEEGRHLEAEIMWKLLAAARLRGWQRPLSRDIA